MENWQCVPNGTLATSLCIFRFSSNGVLSCANCKCIILLDRCFHLPNSLRGSQMVRLWLKQVNDLSTPVMRTCQPAFQFFHRSPHSSLRPINPSQCPRNWIMDFVFFLFSSFFLASLCFRRKFAKTLIRWPPLTSALIHLIEGSLSQFTS